MRKIAHIINPVIVNPSSDLFIAQPVTFESIRIAKEKAEEHVHVELFTAQYREDTSLAPPYFVKTSDLDRSVLDYGTFKKEKKLPLIKDILDRLYRATDARYLIYTNVDIGLKPDFYIEVNKIIDKGYDAFMINRRTISSTYRKPEELDTIYKNAGKKHPGYDCFVFKKELFPKLKLGKIVIGATWVGLALATNLISYADKARVFKNLHLTFHIGEDRSWRNAVYDDYSHHNHKEYITISKEINSEIGKLTRIIKHYRPLSIFKFINMLLKYL